MKDKRHISTGMQDLCRRLKLQLDELNVQAEPRQDQPEQLERQQLIRRLKTQIAELSK